MGAELLSETVGRTMVLTICDRDHRNALGPGVYAAGIEALNAAGDNPDIRSVVIAGEGGMFSAGGNLARLQKNRELPVEIQASSIESLHLWIEELRVFPKPVIAAVEGAAAGAGFSLALACDMIIAAQDAIFCMSYARIGLSPDGGATWQFVRALPRALAIEWLMLGTRVTAQRMYDAGLVNQVVPSAHALPAALALAERLNDMAPNAVRSVKELLDSAERSTLSEQLTYEQTHFVNNLHHDNAGVGIDAFQNKTKPLFY